MLSIKLLLIEDNAGDIEIIKYYIGKISDISIELCSVSFLHEGIHKIRNEDYDVVLSDLNLPDSTGLNTLKTLRSYVSHIPILVLTEIDDDKLGVESIKEGAQDYIVKSELTPRLLSKTLYYAIERNKLINTIQKLAYKDNLTNLFNRAAIIEQLDKEILTHSYTNKKIGVLFLDLDKFKEVNDNLGHSYGDELLRILSEKIQNSVRDYDYIGRVGGDEFIIIIPNLKARNEVLTVLDRVTTVFLKPIMVDVYSFFIKASIGVSFYPEDGTDSESLIKNADIAMYKAKQKESSGIEFFSNDMLKEIEETFIFSNDLRYAVKNNELELLYQPIKNLEEGSITIVEALLRWHHPKYGLISPTKFIPIAEKNDSIIEIGEWVLRKACNEAVKWQKKDKPPITISVNISVRQLQHDGFVQTVVDIIEESGLDPKCLLLEITESIALSGVNIEPIIDGLCNHGIRFAIDDFGTCYSSLKQLQQMQVAMLKIDKEFIRSINNDKHSNSIVRAILSLANSLNIKVIAEGIETSEQLNFLEKEKCEMGQGYLFSRPVNINKILNILK